MAVKKLYWLPPVLGLTFAAGWFSRSAPATAVAPDSRTLLQRVAQPGVVVPAGAQNPADPAATETVPAARPLTSLSEIMGLLESLGKSPDELAMLPLMDLLPRLMVTDAPTVRRLLEELAADNTLDKEGNLFPIATGSLLFRWMTVQPEAAAGFLLTHPEKLGDLHEMAPFLIAWAERSRAGAGERLLALAPEEDREDMGEILRKQALMADPAKTLRDPAQFGKLDGSDIQNLASHWLSKDAPGLLAWRMTLEEGTQRESVDRAILESISEMKGDPARVENRIAALPPALAAQARIALLSKEIAEASEEQPVDGGRTPALLKADPATYAARLNTLLAADAGGKAIDGEAVADAVRRVGVSFAQEEKFSEAAAWTATLPEGDARETAVTQLVLPWLDKDAPAASAWIDTLPAGSLRDAAAQKLIDKIESDDPVNALVWARALGDETSRQNTISGIYKSWFGTDPAAASHAILSLPPEEQAKLKEISEKKPDGVVVD